MKVTHKRKHKATLLDKSTYICGVLLPVSTIPQAYNIIVNKQTAGVSLFTWSFYLLTSSLFAIYGLAHHEKLLIVTYIPFVMVELAIVLGLLII